MVRLHIGICNRWLEHSRYVCSASTPHRPSLDSRFNFTHHVGLLTQEGGRGPHSYDASSVRNYVFDIILSICHASDVCWVVALSDEFVPEFYALSDDVQDQLLALVGLLRQFGPNLKRPRADTLKDSRHANMKELRFSAADGDWRVAFAFDSSRWAILLVAGDKSGGSEKRFYRELIRKADERFAAHLARLKQERL